MQKIPEKKNGRYGCHLDLWLTAPFHLGLLMGLHSVCPLHQLSNYQSRTFLHMIQVRCASPPPCSSSFPPLLFFPHPSLFLLCFPPGTVRRYLEIEADKGRFDWLKDLSSVEFYCNPWNHFTIRRKRSEEDIRQNSKEILFQCFLKGLISGT